MTSIPFHNRAPKLRTLAQRPESPKVQDQSSTRGASIFIDSFQSQTAHGFKVEDAAASMGPIGASHHYCQRDAGGGSLPHLDSLQRLTPVFASGPLSKAEANAQLDQFLNSASSGYLNLVSDVLDEVKEVGFQNSVVNASLGLDELVLLQLLGHPVGPKSRLSAQQREHYQSNLESCLETEAQASGATLDSSLSRRERAILRDKLLLKRIGRTLRGSNRVKAATDRWRSTVQDFESNNNSVVVASGNSGQHTALLSRLGFELDGNEDRNLLAVAEVTTVGASQSTPEGATSLASSSSFGSEVDLLADGSHGASFGTSYSAPKVANTMRAVHQRHPEMTSDQVEAFVKDNLGHTVSAQGHTLAILDLQSASNFLA